MHETKTSHIKTTTPTLSVEQLTSSSSFEHVTLLSSFSIDDAVPLSVTHMRHIHRATRVREACKSNKPKQTSLALSLLCLQSSPTPQLPGSVDFEMSVLIDLIKHASESKTTTACVTKQQTNTQAHKQVHPRTMHAIQT